MYTETGNFITGRQAITLNTISKTELNSTEYHYYKAPSMKIVLLPWAVEHGGVLFYEQGWGPIIVKYEGKDV